MADNKDEKRPKNADGTYNVAKGSNLLSKLLMKKINKSKAKKAAIKTMPGNTKLEKRLNFAGAKARAKKAQREKVKEAKKAATTKLSDKQASKFEKFAGVKSTVTPKKRQAGDKIASAKPKAKVVQPKKKGVSKVDSTAGMTFNQAFAAARKAGQKRFEWRGKDYNTKMAMGGAKLDYADGGKMLKYKDGGKLKEVPADAKGLSKLPKGVRNKMGYAKHGGGIMIVMPVKKSKKEAMYGAKMKKKAMYGAKMKKK
jgi:hypothetical protein